ncbi:glycoside hydrolase family 125 protein [Paenibacillus sp. p3-SID1389]|uniref:glycoside hydrolase family 125 protein n=1 Tax=Paenibacillus sp. p3-SID1389 TaxID=2916364 RepID=UPI0021A5101A|nr:glycoside hydrolase family 125 protein [Paenibacillus sp. p3-SID1389]MCT2194485.1 glycoside hydrolase family 125 protein [Paenibacillus sp. p3-SID1389]
MTEQLTQSDIIVLVETKMKHRPKIVEMFKRCYENTLETTIHRHDDGTVFMLTGDIPAMWLRDSVNQLRPYLIPAAQDAGLREIIEGVLRTQYQSILRDPYANAFNELENFRGHQTDLTEMSGWIWERKYEVDSLCYPLQLAYLYWKNTGETRHFTPEFKQAAELILQTWRTEQRHEKLSKYTFVRENSGETDRLPGPVGYTGMTWSGFRPSDDACKYGYLVPSNLFAIVVLGYLLEINERFFGDDAFADEVRALREDIRQGIEKYAIIEDAEFGKVYAYEVDGLGGVNLMDDANVPSLLSLPYLDYCSKDDPIYLNTRRMILSRRNPYYYEGTYAKGIGSPHTPPDYIWHIALSIQGITALEEAEKLEILDMFERTDAGTNLVHEGFHKDNPSEYTREWFSWSNAMFVEFVLSLCGLEIAMR